MSNGGWIFISHSHQDIKLVREIRNQFEKRGFEPLMFYLKCLSDEDEIVDLIKREIDEREWFVYIDSPNARASNWVKTEREYIKQKNKRNFTIDLESDINEQLKRIEHIARQLKVFISYSNYDRVLKRKIKEKLTEKELLVLDLETSVVGEFLDWTKKSIEEASKDGFVLLILSKYSLKSKYVADEIQYALKSTGRIIPIIVGNLKYEDLPEELKYIVSIRMSENPSDAELEELLNKILSQIQLC